MEDKRIIYDDTPDLYGLLSTKGIPGPVGPQGPKGDKGDTGSMGVQGPQGIQGPQGNTGATGNGIESIAKTGQSGNTDVYTITFTNGTTTTFTVKNGDKGDTGATGPKGDTGEKGDTGATGPKGDPGIDTGLTNNVKQALLQLASKVAYIDEDGQDYYDDLYNSLYDNYWDVTNTLVHAETTNPATNIVKGAAYSATISASVGYTLTGATVSVTMNGADITATAYNNGTISIPSVTGDVVITVVAVAVELASISATYTQSGTVYDTDSLDGLKADLVVTATYSDSSTAIVPSSDYTLSGTLTAGTSIITVTYEAKTTTFNVTVSIRQLIVYNGKGTSGTSILDNANRALSETFDVTDVTSITVQNPNITDYIFSIKEADSDTTVLSVTNNLLPDDYIGTSRTPSGDLGAWAVINDKLNWCKKNGSIWEIIAPTTGSIRLLFRKDMAGTSPITTLDGTEIYINDVKYTIVAKTAGEFE